MRARPAFFGGAVIPAVGSEGKGGAAFLAAQWIRWGRLAVMAVLAVLGAWAHTPTLHLLSLPGGGTSATIPYGATATLTADFANGTGVIKDEADTTVFSNVVSLNPYTTGPLTQSKTYTLTVVNSAGDSVSSSVTVTVDQVSVSAISPADPTAQVGAIASFLVPAVSGAADASVTWSASGGEFAGSGAVGSVGYWKAPSTPGTYTVTATSVADPSRSATTTVTVQAPPVITGFSPAAGTIPSGGSTTLTANWTGNGNASIWGGPASPYFPTNGVPISTGTMTSGATFGLYLDPPQTYGNQIQNGNGELGNAAVIAGGYGADGLVNDPANANSGSWARKWVTGTGYQLHVLSRWTPAQPGDQVRLSAYVKASAAWSANPTALIIAYTDAAGNYLTGQYSWGGFIPATSYVWQSVSGTVPAGAAGFYATWEFNPSAEDLGKSVFLDDLALIFVPNAYTTVNVSTVSVGAISPATPSVTVNQTQAFSATASGGSTNNLNWTATGGAFSPTTTGSGASTTWTAPGTPGTYTVTATSAEDGTKSSSTTVTVIAAPSGSASLSTTNPLYGANVTVTPNFSGGTGALGYNQGTNDISANATSGVGYLTNPVLGMQGYWLRVTNPLGAYSDAYAGTATPASVSVSAVAPAGASVTVGKTLPLNAQALGAADPGVDWYVNGVNGGSASLGVIDGRMLLTNPTFDASGGSDTGAATWGIYNNTPSQEPATGQWITSGGVDGGAFVRVSWSVNNTSTKGILTLGEWGSNCGVVGGWKPFTTYRITWWARGSGSNVGGWMGLAWNTSPANIIYPKGPGLASVWQQYEALLTTNATVESNGHLYIYLGSNTNGTLDFDKVSVREVPNALKNWDFSGGTTANWTVTWDPFGSGVPGMNLNADWAVPGMNTVYVHQPGILNQTNVYYEYLTATIPITGGNTYRASAFTGAHRCRVGVYAFYYDAGGNFVGYAGDVANSENNEEASGGNNLTGYKWTYATGPAPANAVSARFCIRKFDTKPGNTDSWLFFLLPKLEAVGGTALYTAPSTPGSYTVQAISDLKPSATSSTTINVVAAPSASISASNTNPLYGEAVSVTPTFVGSNAVVGSGSYGASDVSANATSGSAISVGAATSTTTYYLRAWNAAGDYADSVVTVTPQTVTISAISGGGGYVTTGYGRAMNATVLGAANGTVNWSATGGSFNAGSTGSGANTIWTAPGTPGVYTIYATSAATGVQTSTSITVVAMPSASLAASPGNPLYGAASGLTAYFSGGTSETLGGYQGGANWHGGPLSSGAYYQITSSTTSSYTGWLRVTNAAGQYADASASVSPQGVTITQGNGVTSASINMGYNFSATVTGSVNTNVNWSASGGSFSSPTTGSGANTTWTAPTSAGNYTVTATAASTGASTSWYITVIGGAGTVTSFTAAFVSDSPVDLFDVCQGNYLTTVTPTRDVVSVSGSFTSAELSRWNGSSFVLVTTTNATNGYTWTWYTDADQGSCASPQFINQAAYGKGTVWRVRTYGAGGWSTFYNVTEN